MSPRTLLLVPLAATALLAQGCGGDSPKANPAPVVASTASQPESDAGVLPPDAAVQDSAVPETGPTVRTVTNRNPLGQLDPDNLLRDGDFELSAPDGMQVAWMGLSPVNARIGASCRSGVRCIGLSAGSYAETSIVWPSAPAVDISFYARITTDDCESEAIGLVMMADSDSGLPTTIGPETPAPVDGWCRYRATVDVPSDPGYHFWVLLVAARSKAAGSSVFDDASMHAVTSSPQGLAAREVEPVAADILALAADARKTLRDRLPADPKPPLPVRNPTGRRGAR